MEIFYLKNIQKNIFRTPPPPKNSCYLRNERLAVAEQGYFPSLKKSWIRHCRLNQNYIEYYKIN
jgi:hypothetical protein